MQVKYMKVRQTSLNRYKTSDGGNIAMITAICLPLVLMIGFGSIDYGLVVQSDQKIRAAASAAALAAVNEAHIAYSAQEDVDLEELVETTAKNVFAARVSELNNTKLTNVKITPVVKNNVFSVDITYSATVDALVMGVVGQKTFHLSNQARAKASATSYVNINMIFDVSGSMGIGATLADQKTVFDATGCAFACHTRRPRGSSSYDVARAAGADMRIDVAREAAIEAVNAVQSTIESPEQVSFSLHKFSNTLTTILPAGHADGANFAKVKTLINDEVQMDIYGTGTNVEYAIETAAKAMPKSGSGRTPDDRIQYIIVMTDGIENSQALEATGGWYAHPKRKVNVPYKQHANHEINYAPGTKTCEKLHKDGTQIYFIHTEYIVPSYGNLSAHNVKRFDFIEDELHDLVPQRFESCAGAKDHVLKADSPKEIKGAFVKLVKEFSSPLRLY